MNFGLFVQSHHVDLRCVGFDLICLLPVGIGVKSHLPDGLGVQARVQKGAQPVEVALWDRIVAMVVALGAADRQAEE